MTATIIGMFMFALAMHIIARISFAKLAAAKILFVSPKLGRIVLIERSEGRLKRYIGNLRGFDKHVQESTGHVEDGEEKRPGWDLLWHIYGVRFIGLDTVYEYDIKVDELTYDESGKPVLTRVVKKATSIHYQGYYYQLLKNIAVGGNSEVNMLLGLNLETVHAGHSLKYKQPDWVETYMGKSASLFREIVEAIPLDKINKIAAERNGGPTTTSVARLMINTLGTDTEGNPSTTTTVGQRLIGLNIITVDFVKGGIQQAMEQTSLNEELAKAAVAQAEGLRLVAEKNAAAIELVGGAENRVLEGAVKAAGDGDKLARIERSRSIGKLDGLQVLNEGGEKQAATSVILDGFGKKV